ncbi:hypothetical protein AKO1_007674 [Acrasis kona]|uniref:Scaffold protein Nfu/NifU N-terminal domain-containing protein n=1 Tax=Acrasis kona TaxID=1008807 RepID=A0AAW2YQD5_9EUKA
MLRRTIQNTTRTLYFCTSRARFSTTVPIKQVDMNKVMEPLMRDISNNIHGNGAFIKMRDTPNPQSLKFEVAGRDLAQPGTTRDYSSPLAAYSSPFAKDIFKLDGVRRVFIADTYLTVTLSDDYSWDEHKLDILASIQNYISSDKPIFDDTVTPNKDTMVQEDDDEVVIAIKEILETKIRPMVQEDGGDVILHSFVDGIAWLKLQGSCSGCPSSSVTLKHGIENMLMHYVPEVEEVRQYEDDLEKANNEQFEKVDKQIQENASQ